MITFIRKGEQVIDASNGLFIELVDLIRDDTLLQYKSKSDPYQILYYTGSANFNKQAVCLLESLNLKLIVTKEELSTLFTKLSPFTY